MRGTIPPLPSAPSWRGSQLKQRDNFTFTLPVMHEAEGLFKKVLETHM
jgi:hypothetical protein